MDLHVPPTNTIYCTVQPLTPDALPATWQTHLQLPLAPRLIYLAVQESWEGFKLDIRIPYIHLLGHINKTQVEELCTA
jgi:hypothetical protein